MTELPKLRIKNPFNSSEDEIIELEQARYRFPFNTGMMVFLLDGKSLQSYEELVKLLGQDEYRDKEVVDVNVLVDVATGG